MRRIVPLLIVALLAASLAQPLWLVPVAKATSLEDLEVFGKPVIAPVPIAGVVFSSVDTDRGQLILVTARNGTFVASLRSFRNLEFEFHTYPLFGAVVSASLDKEPGSSLLALGSDRGEVLVVNVSSFQPIFTYVHGDAIPVRKVWVGGGKAVALFASTPPVVRVFTLTRGGWAEIGSFIGSAVTNPVPGYIVSDAEMLRELRRGYVVQEPVLAVSFTPVGNVEIRAVVINGSTGQPIPSAVVYAYVENLKIFTTQGVSDANGTVVLRTTAPVINMTVYANVNGTCYSWRFTNLTFIEPGASYVLPEPLNVSSQYISACPTYRLPMLIDVLDVRNDTPRRLERIGVNTTKPSIDIYSFLGLGIAKSFRYLLVIGGFFADLPPGYALRFLYLDRNFSVVDNSSTWYPIRGSVTSIGYSSDGRVVAVGTSEGVVYIFYYIDELERYKLLWGYRMPSSVTGLAVSDTVAGDESMEGVVVMDSSGDAQVLLVNGTLMKPLMRIDTVLYFTTGSGASVSSSRDLEIVVMSASSVSYICLGMGTAAHEHDPINPDDYVLIPVEVVVLDPRGEPLPGAEVTVLTPDLKHVVVHGFTDPQGRLRIRYMKPGTYVLRVETHREYIAGVTKVISIRRGVSRIEVRTSYRPVKVVLRLVDSYTNGSIEEGVKLFIDNKSIYVAPGRGEVELSLMPGNYSIAVKPMPPKGEEPLYAPAAVNIAVPQVRNATVRLARLNYTVTVEILDSLTKSALREGFRFIAYSPSGALVMNRSFPPGTRAVVLTLREKGVLRVSIEPMAPKGEEPRYVGVSREFNVTGSTRLTLEVPQRRLALTLVVVDERTGGPPLVPVDVVVDGVLAATIPANSSSVRIDVFKGLHTIKIVPRPEFGKERIPLYSSKELRVNVVRSTSLKVLLSRNYVRLSIRAVDSLTKRSPIGVVEVVFNGSKVGELANGFFSSYVPVGRATLVLRSVNRIYRDFTTRLELLEDTTVNATLVRNLLPMRITVLSDMGDKLSGATVVARGLDVPFTSSTVTVDGEASLMLPYGMFKICVDMPGYYPSCINVVVKPGSAGATVVLKPRVLTIIMRYLPIIVGVAVLATVLGVIYRYRSRLMELISPEEEVI
ncbi:MAG: hypothetical protein DRO39_03575 [Thermoprotei archaeon]|nr:MAG: hypothetical protein DRO39_03575 [Thermoprotei archaeon]